MPIYHVTGAASQRSYGDFTVEADTLDAAIAKAKDQLDYVALKPDPGGEVFDRSIAVIERDDGEEYDEGIDLD